MGTCEKCDSEQVKTYECKDCGTNFCVQCGASHKRMCYDCRPKGSGGGPIGFLKGLFGL